MPPVLACFADQDARVRYYACESMYNIAKVAKGEILVYFNQVFDALCKVVHPSHTLCKSTRACLTGKTQLAADNELSVKNGAELLDRLIKDIVAESAASYVSILHAPEDTAGESGDDQEKPSPELPTAFSLERFLPLLEERINVLSPFTRTFLVAWITLLDSIPDLELVAYLPRFLGGLFKFLSDENQDVYTATQTALDRFLSEIRKIARIKRGIAESKKSQGDDFNKSTSSLRSGGDVDSDADSSAIVHRRASTDEKNDGSSDSASIAIDDDKSASGDGDWMPGQDVYVDHPRILEILVKFLEAPHGDKGTVICSNMYVHKLTIPEVENHEVLLTTLRWIDAFFDICPEEIMPFVPSLLTHVLPRMSHDLDSVRQAAIKVNASLMDYIMSLSDDSRRPEETTGGQIQLPTSLSALGKELTGAERRDSNLSARLLKTVIQDRTDVRSLDGKGTRTPTPAEERVPSPRPIPELDYQAAVGALTLQFLNEHEATRVAAIAWLIMLHRMAPGKVGFLLRVGVAAANTHEKILSVEDGTFPALLKTLSDPSEAVVTRDLLLLSQISKNSDDSYFTSFMVNLLKLFCTDRRLLETRGNLIIRQLCVTLSAERIYRTMADCLEKDEASQTISK